MSLRAATLSLLLIIWPSGVLAKPVAQQEEPKTFPMLRSEEVVKIDISIGAFVGVSVFVGGAVLTALVAPPFWLLSAVLAIEGSESVLGPYGDAVMQASFFSLLGGTLILTVIAMLAPIKRCWFRLVPCGATVFLYWLLISVAAYKALWQLCRHTFYWEKTEHGVRRHRRIRFRRA